MYGKTLWARAAHCVPTKFDLRCLTKLAPVMRENDDGRFEIAGCVPGWDGTLQLPVWWSPMTRKLSAVCSVRFGSLHLFECTARIWRMKMDEVFGTWSNFLHWYEKGHHRPGVVLFEGGFWDRFKAWKLLMLIELVSIVKFVMTFCTGTEGLKFTNYHQILHFATPLPNSKT